MSTDFDLATYYPIFLFMVAILGFAVAAMSVSHLVGPERRTPVKMMPYESGMDPIGDAHQHYDVKFYLVAILFLVFDVELLFLYPWAVSSAGTYDNLASVSQGGPAVASLIPAALVEPVFWEIIVFLVTLAIGYLYAWRRGVFQWR